MNLFELIAVLLALAALFAYLNHRLLRLPTTIGVMAIGLVFSVLLLALPWLGWVAPSEWARSNLAAVNFDKTVLEGMLAVLLFAGALHVRLSALGREWRVIALLATVGVVAATVLIGTGIYALQWLLPLTLSFAYCLVFGALIAPTDPVAVLGIVEKLGLPRGMQTKIAGESLFNDGFAVVVFLTLAGWAGGHATGIAEMSWLFVKEVGGGIVLGLALGALGYWLLRGMDDYVVEVLVTLALVIGGYALALAWHFSGPLAVVVAGLVLGNQAREYAMSEHTRERLDEFWELMDELLNIILFLLVGLELLVIDWNPWAAAAGAVAIPLVLAVRFLAVGGVVQALSPIRDFERGVVPLMTWGGLRGGISVALALSITAGEARDTIVTMTYVVVIFSILVQGLTLAPLVSRLRSRA